ncbi:hypothetical protein P167DRAFT_539999 [Morchella conica CCBAS932]|uniref:Uncharacterized protein n=1 Tax=Morchella conica CCBAS932 TaxID=1392247 RepID=A0A3N4KAP6_9PEZI|nr:hypothetical protein P167DRAFT_539999 [Morchella conica CCBAS932]
MFIHPPHQRFTIRADRPTDRETDPLQAGVSKPTTQPAALYQSVAISLRHYYSG